MCEKLLSSSLLCFPPLSLSLSFVLEQACSKLLTSKEGVTHQSLTRETLFTGQQKEEHERNRIRSGAARSRGGDLWPSVCV